MAAESTKGRRLLVATTNLDTAESVIWDLGAIAARGGEMFDEMHVDGETTTPFLIPTMHPSKGALDFGQDAMHALFEYGQRYAECGRLWIAGEDAVERSHRVASNAAVQSQDCPGD